jgi:ribosomal protein S17
MEDVKEMQEEVMEEAMEKDVVVALEPEKMDETPRKAMRRLHHDKWLTW